MKRVFVVFLTVSLLWAAKEKKPIEWITGTLLEVSSERGNRFVDGDSLRNDITYYTIDDGQKYIYVLKRTLRRRRDKELVVTEKAPIKFAIISDEEFLIMDDKGETHKLSLQKRSARMVK
ncbi:MAG TPA: hypothetical protein VI685_21105 [Candidatus Angelobacter sp.]